MKKSFWIMIGLVGTITFAGILAFVAEDPTELAIKNRAEKVFAFDKTHPNHLPAHRVTSLSMAIGFANYEGAEQLITELEPQMGIQLQRSWALRHSTVQNFR